MSLLKVLDLVWILGVFVCVVLNYYGYNVLCSSVLNFVFCTKRVVVLLN
jgi:hypothetical protein